MAMTITITMTIILIIKMKYDKASISILDRGQIIGLIKIMFGVGVSRGKEKVEYRLSEQLIIKIRSEVIRNRHIVM